MSSAHAAQGYGWVTRQVKHDNQWRLHLVRRPQVIADYNNNMLGVDKSDQLIAGYAVLRKCMV